MRTYTVRQERLDAVYPEIDVDFVLHFDAAGNGGPAATWALNAKPGDSLVLIGPNNRAAHCVTAESYSGIEWRPGLAQRVLLAGDETAVPAISSILESLPPYMSGHAILEVPDAATSRTSPQPPTSDYLACPRRGQRPAAPARRAAAGSGPRGRAGARLGGRHVPEPCCRAGTPCRRARTRGRQH